MTTTRAPAARRPIAFGDLAAVLTITALMSMLLYALIPAASARPDAAYRETGCWSDPMSDQAPLACGEHAARIRAENGAVGAR